MINFLILILILILIFSLVIIIFYDYENFIDIKDSNLTEEINKIYYINLDRRPERNEHFLNSIKKFNFKKEKIVRFKAIDGLTYNFSDEEKQMFINADFINTDAEFKIMGNQLSHYYILKDMISNNYNYILIFQDDVVFIDNFNEEINNLINNIPEDAEIINFGFHKVASLSYFEGIDLNNNNENIVDAKEIINNHICKLPDYVNPCSLSYLVTLKGAKNLIEYFGEVGFLKATDWNYNDYLMKKDINYGSIKALCTGNSSFKSDIFSEN